MSTESIVSKQPAVQSNPFAKESAAHLSAGTVAIESERAVAEAQGKLVIAKRFPRNQALAYANIIDACRRPGLAEEAGYSFPRGGEVIMGPSIRLAEMLAANWGNVDYGLRELSRKEGVSEMEAYCWDLETNTMSSQKFTVRHIRDTRAGAKALTDERDIYELTANLGARRLRARILAILPADLVQAAVDQCKKTIAGGGDLPIADRIRKMVLAFKSLGVPAALIEKRLGHPLDSTTGDELVDLLQIHNSLRDGMSALGDWFGDGKPADDIPMGDEPKQERATPPPRAKRERGANAIPTTPPPEAQGAESKAAEKPAEKPSTAPAPEPEPTPAAPEPEPVPEAPKPRTTINAEETIVVLCTVERCDGIVINDTVSGRKTPMPSVSATLSGEYSGPAYHIGGATLVNGKDNVPNAPWAVGAKLKVTLFGRFNNVSKQVLPVVKSVEAAETTVEVG